MIIEHYFDFLADLLSIRSIAFFLFSIISLITLLEITLRRKNARKRFFTSFFINSIVLMIGAFLAYTNNPSPSISSQTVEALLLKEYPDINVWSSILTVLNVILFFTVRFEKEDTELNVLAHIDHVIEWCVENYPKSGVRKRPKTVLSQEESDNKGEYSPSTRAITIYAQNIESKKDLTDTIIHEYFHFYLHHGKSFEAYNEKLNSVGYEAHPEELICNISAEKLTEIYLEQHGD
ncbi:MAG: hypothetical protein PVK00_03690 [Flavobacteriales bacterium]